jgi:hypothetical protein
MEITNAKYYGEGENVGIAATIDGEFCAVPLAPGNRHYDEIMRQVEAGTLTIADAE